MNCDVGQEPFAAWKIQNRQLKLVRVFADQPESSEIVLEVAPDGSRCRPEQFQDVQLGDNVVVDFKQHPEPIPLLGHLSLVTLCAISCGRALERDRNVRC